MLLGCCSDAFWKEATVDLGWSSNETKSCIEISAFLPQGDILQNKHYMLTGYFPSQRFDFKGMAFRNTFNHQKDITELIVLKYHTCICESHPKSWVF